MALPNGRTSSFLERMRAPQTMGGSSWQYNAPTSAIAPGELDPVDNVMNLIRRERDRDYATQLQGGGGWGGGGGFGGGGFGGGGRGLRQVGQGLAGNPGGAIKPMDVVYNQGPEFAQQQLKMRKDAMDQNQKNIDIDRATDAQRYNDAYIENRRKPVEMSDQAKLAMQFANAQALEGQRGANNLAERNLQNKGAYDVALEGRREAARAALELAGVNNAAKSADLKLASDVRREAANTPKAQSEAMDLKLRQLQISRPDLAAAFNEDGTINPAADPNLLAEIERVVIPRRTDNINLPPETLPPQRINPVPLPPAAPVNALPGAGGSAGLGGQPAAPTRPVTSSVIPPHAAPPVAPINSAPPPGFKPGGKWVVSASGRRVYKEP